LAVLAHQAGGGGGGDWLLPLLLVGAALVAAGLSRRSKPGVPRWTAGGLVVLGVATVIGGVLLTNRDRGSDVHLTIVEPAFNATVPADQPVKVRVAVEGGDLATGPKDRTGGHLHLSVDGKLQQMPYGTEMDVTLARGRHAISVEYVDNRHASFRPPVVQAIEVIAL
jgi:hypothetical protein